MIYISFKKTKSCPSEIRSSLLAQLNSYVSCVMHVYHLHVKWLSTSLTSITLDYHQQARCRLCHRPTSQSTVKQLDSAAADDVCSILSSSNALAHAVRIQPTALLCGKYKQWRWRRKCDFSTISFDACWTNQTRMDSLIYALIGKCKVLKAVNQMTSRHTVGHNLISSLKAAPVTCTEQLSIQLDVLMFGCS